VDAMLQKIRPGDRAGFANSRREGFLVATVWISV